MDNYNEKFINNAGKIIDLKDKVVLEIGCGNGNDVKTMARLYQPKKIIGIDKYLDSWWTTIPTKGDMWEIQDGDAMKLDFQDETFDVILSLATFEHISDVKMALSEIKRVLKPFGKFYTEFSPIWTSIIGHHYDFWITPERAELIPPWGQLWMIEEEMLKFLTAKIGKEQAVKACEFIYHNNIINRTTRNELYDIFVKSGLWIKSINESICFSRTAHFGNSASELTEEIRNKLRENSYDPEEVAVSGFNVLMEKYANV